MKKYLLTNFQESKTENFFEGRSSGANILRTDSKLNPTKLILKEKKKIDFEISNPTSNTTNISNLKPSLRLFDNNNNTTNNKSLAKRSFTNNFSESVIVTDKVRSHSSREKKSCKYFIYKVKDINLNNLSNNNVNVNMSNMNNISFKQININTNSYDQNNNNFYNSSRDKYRNSSTHNMFSRERKQLEINGNNLGIPKSSSAKLFTNNNNNIREINSGGLSVKNLNLVLHNSNSNSASILTRKPYTPIISTGSSKPRTFSNNSNTITNNTGYNSNSVKHNSIPKLDIQNINLKFNQFEKAKFSNKGSKLIKTYAVNSYQGLVRICVVLNINEPEDHNIKGLNWPVCCFFAVIDGHGGNLCADFLKENLYQFIIKDINFPTNPAEALKSGFANAEKEFLYKKAINKFNELKDRSGACAVVVLIVDDMCYIANTGDCRTLSSKDKGKTVEQITRDHKPDCSIEKKRIESAGGTKPIGDFTLDIPLPFRIQPGGLSVARAFGDAEAKFSNFGGKIGVLIATPDIYSFRITPELDFLVMGCDGIFDVLSNGDVSNCVWLAMNEIKSESFHKNCGASVDMIMKTSLQRNTYDNISCIVIGFENFEKYYYHHNIYFNQDNGDDGAGVGEYGTQNLNTENVERRLNQTKKKFPSINKTETNDYNDRGIGGMGIKKVNSPIKTQTRNINFSDRLSLVNSSNSGGVPIRNNSNNSNNTNNSSYSRISDIDRKPINISTINLKTTTDYNNGFAKGSKR